MAETGAPNAMPIRLLSFTMFFIVAALSVYLLVSGRELLIPFAIAIIVWYVINAMARAYGRIPFGKHHAPRWLTLSVALLTVLALLVLLVEMIGSNFASVSQAAPKYQENLEALIHQGARLLGVEHTPTLTQLLDQIDAKTVLVRLGGAAAGVAGNIGVIIIYVAFLLIEQGSFDRKMTALFPTPEREEAARKLLSRIQSDVQTYIWIKTVLSVLTGTVSYIFLIAVGVDFAAFWAVIIFFLNYIPTVGSILGVVFPALLALVQFPSIGPFLIIAVGLSSAQMIIGNVLEPRLMGHSLNMSPLVVILSLAVWGSIWGVAGMFLCVPITVIMMIVFAQFPQTRPIAIALSSDGKVD